MRARVRVVGMLLMAVSLVGCGGTDNSNAAPTKWMGSTRHLRVVGKIMGEDINININGATANDTTKLWSEREYQVPNGTNGMPDYAMGHNSEVRVKGLVTINGQMRLLDIGLKRQDWQADAPGTVIPVIPRDDTNSPCGLASCTNKSAWLSWTWRNPATNSVMYKSAAQSGSITLGEYVGTPDSTGLIIPPGTGNVGAFATGQWSATESITLSFDANNLTNTEDNTY